jgi:hypothetical protein
VEIVGNDITHERVIREAIVLLPGDLFNRELLIDRIRTSAISGSSSSRCRRLTSAPRPTGWTWTSCSGSRRNGPATSTSAPPSAKGRRWRLYWPGRAEPVWSRKKGSLRWQFGANINDFTLSYTDPAIRRAGSPAHFRYSIRGRRTWWATWAGASSWAGWFSSAFPFLGSRYTRIYTSYGLQRISYSQGSDDSGAVCL